MLGNAESVPFELNAQQSPENGCVLKILPIVFWLKPQKAQVQPLYANQYDPVATRDSTQITLGFYGCCRSRMEIARGRGIHTRHQHKGTGIGYRKFCPGKSSLLDLQRLPELQNRAFKLGQFI